MRNKIGSCLGSYAFDDAGCGKCLISGQCRSYTVDVALDTFFGDLPGTSDREKPDEKKHLSEVLRRQRN